MLITRRPLTFVLVLAATLAAALFVLPRLVPGEYMRRHLAEALEQETGIALDRAGGIHLALLPRPGLVLDEVMLRMPGLGGLPPLAAERVIADIDAWALLDGRLRIGRLRIERPVLTFHVNAAGERNWDLGALRPLHPVPVIRTASLRSAPLEPEMNAPTIPTLRSRRPRLPTAVIEIHDGLFAYHDETRELRSELSHVSLLLTSSRAQATASLDGGFELKGQAVTARASLRDQPSLPEPSSQLRIEIGAAAGAAVFEGLASWKEERSLRGALRFDLASGAALARWLGDVPALAGLDRASLGGTLLVDDRRAMFDKVRLQAGEATGDLDIAVEFDGRGRLELHSLYLHGGRAAGRVTVDAQRGAAVVGGLFEIADMDTMALLKGLSGFDWVSGRANGTLNVAGGGGSLPAVLATLTGEGALTVSDGAVEGLDIPALIARAREGEFKPWRRREGNRTRFDTLTSTFTLDKGLAKSRELTLTGPEIAATGEGHADIPRQSLDYRLMVKVKAATEAERAKAEDGQVAIPLILRGPWEKPDIYPDLDKVLRDPKALNDAASAAGKALEKLTEGKIKADDVGKAIEQLFGGGKKKKKETETAE